MPMFELTRNTAEGTGLDLNPDSEVRIESTAQLFGIHPFYIARGELVFMIVSNVSIMLMVSNR